MLGHLVDCFNDDGLTSNCEISIVFFWDAIVEGTRPAGPSPWLYAAIEVSAVFCLVNGFVSATTE